MKLFGRSKEEDSTTVEDKGAGKGRPTPKRKDAEARNRRPLVADRKEARRRRREQRDEIYKKQREALDGTGDERYLPVNDQGPLRRYIRDFVDARFAIGELFMPIVLAFLILSIAFSRNRQLNSILLFSMWGLLLLALIESIILTVIVNRLLMKVTDGDKRVKQGNGRYILMRLASPRRMRRPRPNSPRGSRPDINEYASDIRAYMLSRP
ncbi:DUF3043 domain-containing protein [Varibaculum vaginae]|uniref:DUF3043 domain-containing protein n=1 Tax=Varibaculum vaginae TaxID=2364797 RepID=UPI000F08AE1E|nr:DUF3043 domain-containing protein [Varibaculum vaginae]